MQISIYLINMKFLYIDNFKVFIKVGAFTITFRIKTSISDWEVKNEKIVNSLYTLEKCLCPTYNFPEITVDGH